MKTSYPASPNRADLLWGPPNLLPIGTSVLYWEVKRPGREVDYSLQSSVDIIENEWSHTLALAIRPHDADRANVPFTVYALVHVQCHVDVFGERFHHVFRY
jgi:hypothetical protein